MNSFAALADPVRRQIVENLAHSGQASASDIAARFNITKSGVSQHLKVLKTAGLVEMQVKAQFRLYSLKPEALEEMAAWLIFTSRQWAKHKPG